MNYSIAVSFNRVLFSPTVASVKVTEVKRGLERFLLNGDFFCQSDSSVLTGGREQS